MRLWSRTPFALPLLLAASSLAAEVPVPPLQGRVTDLTSTLTQEEKKSIELRLEALESSKGSQVVVLLIPTTGEESIEQYSIRVAEAWKIGRKGIDDGVILLVARNDRKLRIEVGYGLEGALTDALTNQIIQEQMVPLLKKGDFAGAIGAGVDSIIRAIEGEPLPAPAQVSSGLENPDWKTTLYIVAFGAVFWIAGVGVALLANKLLSLAAFVFGSGASVYLVLWAGQPWILAYVAGGAAAFSIGVVSVLLFSRSSGSGSSSGSSSGGWSSSSGSSSSSSSSGGGGSFGGGGSSGSW